MIRKFAFTAAMLMLLSSFTGCTGYFGTKQNNTVSNPAAQQQEKKEYTWKGTLYFSDTNAMYIQKEEREMKVAGDSSGKADKAVKAKKMLEEMIKGPKEEELSASIPKNTEVKSVAFENDTAIVDLSKEFIDDNPGGSAGEIMALAPIVLLLTDFEGVKQVSIKINGQQQVEFKGHFELDKPLLRTEFEQYIKE